MYLTKFLCILPKSFKFVTIPLFLYSDVLELLDSHLLNLSIHQTQLRKSLKITPQGTTDFTTLIDTISTIQVEIDVTKATIKSLKSHNHHAN